MPIWLPDNATMSSQLYNEIYTSTWPRIYTTTGTGTNWLPQNVVTGSAFTSTTPTWQVYPLVIEIDEEDYILNQQEYWELARQRGVRFQIRTATERARREAEAAERAARHEREMAERAEATERSRLLLLDHLRPEQRRTFDEHKWFVVQGGRTLTRYRIRGHGINGNVDVLGIDDRVTGRLCAHCRSDLPLYDHLLAQKLVLEHDEDTFLRVANRSAA